MGQREEDFSLLDILLAEDLPEEEDEQDVDWSLQQELEEKSRDESWSLRAGNYRIGNEPGSGATGAEQSWSEADYQISNGNNNNNESSIFRQTRRQVNLEDKDIFDLTLDLPGGWEPGDWEEGSKEYKTYTQFLENLQKDEDLQEDDVDDDFYHRDRSVASVSGSEWTIKTRQRSRHKTKGAEEEGAAVPPHKLRKRHEMKQRDNIRAFSSLPLETLVGSKDPYESAGFSIDQHEAIEQFSSTLPEENEDCLSGDQLREIYRQAHAHTQMLMQHLVLREERSVATPEAAERLIGSGDSKQHGMLNDIIRFYQWQSSKNKMPFEIWDSEGPAGREIQEINAPLNPANEREQSPLSIWDNPLTRRLTDVEFDCQYMRFVLKGSTNPLLDDLQRHTNSDFVPNGDKVKMKNRQMLFTPAEDELLAIAIPQYGLQYDLIQRHCLPAKSRKNLKNRVANLRHRCKGNKVKTALLEYRNKPLSEEEIATVREGIVEHGLRWILISRRYLPWREGLHLEGLWNDHIQSSEEDRVLTERSRLKKMEEPPPFHDNHKNEIQCYEEELAEEGQAPAPGPADHCNGLLDQEHVDYPYENGGERKGLPPQTDAIIRDEGVNVAAPPLQQGAKWCKDFDRVILHSVVKYGATSEAFSAAWNHMGAHASPFDLGEISQRYSWICQTLGFER